jgi:hypothetical protein
MTTADRLATIRARCVLISQQDYRPDTSLPSGLPSTTVAMALTCIAAIDTCQPITEENLPLVQSILAAWE